MITHLTKIDDLNMAQIESILSFSKSFQEHSPFENFENIQLLNLFFEDSTRTKYSFEKAAKNLKCSVTNFAVQTSSIKKQESVLDTIETLAQFDFDILVTRSKFAGFAEFAVKTLENINSTGIVINAGDGFHEHPTQALIDLYTLVRNLAKVNSIEDLASKSILISGDVLHSRVARSNIELLKRLEVDISIVGPVTPTSGFEKNHRVFYNFDQALAKKEYDAIMVLRLQQERMLTNNFFPSIAEYSELWGLTTKRFKNLSTSTLLLHPGPVNRNVEICDLALKSKQSLILDQVRNSQFVRMAILKQLLIEREKKND